MIVGGSVAGVNAARALRGEGYTGPIVLVGEEPHIPYDRPPLTKQLLTGAWPIDRANLLDIDGAKDAHIDMRLGVRAARLETAEQRLVLQDGSFLPYDAAIIATGASARPSPWQPESGVHVLRTLDDLASLQQSLEATKGDDGEVLIIGAGFIGAEVASSLRAGNRRVSMVDSLEVPMGRIVGPELGRFFNALHERHGIRTHFGTGVESIQGRLGSLAVRLGDGTELCVGVVLVGIGAVPNADWLAGSQIPVDDGVLCDEWGLVEGVPNVYAVGDVARWRGAGESGWRRREHWTSAVEQAQVVAQHICGTAGRAEPLLDYIWTDQYDWRAQIIGRPETASSAHVIGSYTENPAKAVTVYGDQKGQLIGAFAVNWPQTIGICRRLLKSRATTARALEQIGELQRASVPAETVGR